jgi:hypothetical protein
MGIRIGTGPLLITTDGKCSLLGRTQALKVEFSVCAQGTVSDMSSFGAFADILPKLPGCRFCETWPTVKVYLERRYVREMFVVSKLLSKQRFGHEMVVLVLDEIPSGMKTLVRHLSTLFGADAFRIGVDDARFVLQLFFQKTPCEIESLLTHFATFDGPRGCGAYKARFWIDDL